VAVDDIFAVHGDTQLGDLLLNDSDPDGNPIYLESYGSLPQHGRLIDGPTASMPFRLDFLSSLSEKVVDNVKTFTRI